MLHSAPLRLIREEHGYVWKRSFSRALALPGVVELGVESERCKPPRLSFMFVNTPTASKDHVCNATAYTHTMHKKTTAAKLSTVIASAFQGHAIIPTQV